jgi:hypothetical protein
MSGNFPLSLSLLRESEFRDCSRDGAAALWGTTTSKDVNSQLVDQTQVRLATIENKAAARCFGPHIFECIAEENAIRHPKPDLRFWVRDSVSAFPPAIWVILQQPDYRPRAFRKLWPKNSDQDWKSPRCGHQYALREF